MAYIFSRGYLSFTSISTKKSIYLVKSKPISQIVFNTLGREKENKNGNRNKKRKGNKENKFTGNWIRSYPTHNHPSIQSVSGVYSFNHTFNSYIQSYILFVCMHGFSEAIFLVCVFCIENVWNCELPVYCAKGRSHLFCRCPVSRNFLTIQCFCFYFFFSQLYNCLSGCFCVRLCGVFIHSLNLVWKFSFHFFCYFAKKISKILPVFYLLLHIDSYWGSLFLILSICMLASIWIHSETVQKYKKKSFFLPEDFR